MKYILMNYKFEVAELDLDLDEKGEENSVVSINILDSKRVPMSFIYSDPAMLTFIVSKWLHRRLMPVLRHNSNCKELNEEIGENRLKTALKFYAVSLTDSYWIKPMTSRKKWEDVNFFTNDFSYDVGNYIFDVKKKKPKTKTPDITTNGQLPKTWRKIEGKWYLFKGGTGPDYSEPCNEEFSSRLLEYYNKDNFKVPFVKYRVVKKNDKLYSVCENFVTEGVEFVPAIDIYQTEAKPSFVTVTQHMINRCKFFDIPGAKEFITNMKTLDFMIGNTDRHLGNWGFLYDVESCKFLGPAPLFDNGTSMANGMPEIIDEPSEYIEKEASEQFQEIKNKMYVIDRPSLPVRLEIESMIKTAYVLANFSFTRIDGLMKRIAGRYTVLDRYIEQAELKHEMYLEKLDAEEERGFQMEIPMEFDER